MYWESTTKGTCAFLHVLIFIKHLEHNRLVSNYREGGYKMGRVGGGAIEVLPPYLPLRKGGGEF